MSDLELEIRELERNQMLSEIGRLRSENENLHLLIDFMEGRGKETQEEITRIRRKIQRDL